MAHYWKERHLFYYREQRSQVILENARTHPLIQLILTFSYLSLPLKAHSIDKSVIFLILVDTKHSIQI